MEQDHGDGIGKPNASDHSVSSPQTQAVVEVCGNNLTIAQLVRVARGRVPVAVTADAKVLERVRLSCDYVAGAVRANQAIYGVTSGVGGMSGNPVSPGDAAEFQETLLRVHKCGLGTLLPPDCVRAAMLARLNSLLRGASGIRLELLQRLACFLNEGITPCVPSLGSIGASGDLVPLSYVAGALLGADPSFVVDDCGRETDAPSALHRRGWNSLRLLPKEGLALINGSSLSAAIAALCAHDVSELLTITVGVHAMVLQAVCGTNQSFHPFIHRHKPHPGQLFAARTMLRLLEGSKLSRDEMDGEHAQDPNQLIQDRYSLRCLPQFLGPLIDTLVQTRSWIETELNSATDNPLVDVEQWVSYHGGNFLAEYVALGLDRLRHILGLAGKHLDVQIGWLMHPDFSRGLAPSLVGNRARAANIGLKGVQLTSNSIVPLLEFYGQSLTDRFPTHAEQFNQNVNSQSFGGALLARESVELYRYLLATSLIAAVQAVDLRIQELCEAGKTRHCDARSLLSPATASLYDAVRQVIGLSPQDGRPYVFDDGDRPLDSDLCAVAADIERSGQIPASLATYTSPLVAGELT